MAKSNQAQRNQQRLELFLTPFQIVPYDKAAAQAYGTVRATLERNGQLIGREDLLIAAHALAADMTLVTNNEQEFLRVPELKIENWASLNNRSRLSGQISVVCHPLGVSHSASPGQ